MNDMAGLGDDARGSLKPLLLGIALMATAGVAPRTTGRSRKNDWASHRSCGS